MWWEQSDFSGGFSPSQLFERSSSDGSLVLQVFGPLTVILSVMGICAATLDLKLLLLVVRDTFYFAAHCVPSPSASRGRKKTVRTRLRHREGAGLRFSSLPPPVLGAAVCGVCGSDGCRRATGSGSGSGDASCLFKCTLCPLQAELCVTTRHPDTISYFVQLKSEKNDNYCGCLILLRAAAGRHRG